MAINLLSAFGCIVFSLKQGGAEPDSLFLCVGGVAVGGWCCMCFAFIWQKLDANSWLRLQNFPLVIIPGTLNKQFSTDVWRFTTISHVKMLFIIRLKRCHFANGCF